MTKAVRIRIEPDSPSFLQRRLLDVSNLATTGALFINSSPKKVERHGSRNQRESPRDHHLRGA